MQLAGFTLGRAPAGQQRLKLKYIASVFKDQFGNFVVTLAGAERPLGLDQRMKRPPTVYLAETDQEKAAALEQQLFDYQRTTYQTPRHLDLVDRVWKSLARGRQTGTGEGASTIH